MYIRINDPDKKTGRLNMPAREEGGFFLGELLAHLPWSKKVIRESMQ
jgi:hypothetical protein